ncbi:MAG TPA: glycosyltransferase family 39 protein [Deltaproteobacteria bacterium]|nr:glycosyltransferase family 39 protein [Deltaproteobacteria bacterium]
MRGARKIIACVVLVAAVAAYSLAFQGSRGLWERDEGRYTNVALRMLDKKDFIVPTLSDEKPHFTKPPLTYWVIAAGVTLLGRNEWGARLGNALAFAGTILVVFAMARRITPQRPWLPPLVYATSIFPFAAANIVTTDTLLTLWEAVAVLGFVEWWEHRDEKEKGRGLVLMWAGFGLAFLTKGPPGLLPLAAVVAFVWLSGGTRKVARLFPAPGIALFAVVGLGWYLLVAATHPGLMAYFIKDEFINRIATGVHRRNPEWYKPLTMYIPALLFGTIPWTLPLLRAASRANRTILSRAWWRGVLHEGAWPAFVALWFAIPFAVFCLSHSRLTLYVLPLFVPLSLAAGALSRFTLGRTAASVLLALWIAALPALKWAVSFYPNPLDSRQMARVIREQVSPVPSEVVFIDSVPFWGLSLYLGCEVERVDIKPTGLPRLSLEESLAHELQEKEKGVLYVVDRRRVDEARALSGRLGWDLVPAGLHDKWVFLAPEKT